MFGWFKKKPKEKETKPPKEEVKEEVKEEIKEDIDAFIDNEGMDEKAFDPDALPDIKDKEDECITDFEKLNFQGYLNIPKDKMIEIMLAFKLSSCLPYEDEARHEEVHQKGGRICADQKIITKARSVGKEMIKQIGKKILSGSFNLTKVSFPIRVMIPQSGLQNAIHQTCIFPLYITKAAYSPDPLERFKLVIVATISSFFWTNTFLKPLNPILGETLQANLNDGTECYCEQISHHPPISYFLVVGPNKIYTYYGYYLLEIGARLNSIQILSKGKRSILFKDGQQIYYDFPNEVYNGTFYGDLRQTSVGRMNFVDEENDIQCTIFLGKNKKKPLDYFSGEIIQQNKKMGLVHGSYLGYINVDNTRYWDYRYITPFKINMPEETLESDMRKRIDLLALKSGDLVFAQQQKEKLEEIQRYDRKLREAQAKKQKKK